MGICCDSCQTSVSCFRGHLERSHAAKKNQKTEVRQHEKLFVMKTTLDTKVTSFSQRLMCIVCSRKFCLKNTAVVLHQVLYGSVEQCMWTPGRLAVGHVIADGDQNKRPTIRPIYSSCSQSPIIVLMMFFCMTGSYIGKILRLSVITMTAFNV